MIVNIAKDLTQEGRGRGHIRNMAGDGQIRKKWDAH
jgi:hypothetical protein